MNNANKVAIDQLIKNQAARVAITQDSHLWFFHVYFNDYVRYEIAPFHREMFRISEDDKINMAVICSFRGSGKSTLMTTSYPIWSILGRMQRKFVVIISQTQEQAKQHFGNLKKELETNDLLKQDLGPFREEDEWNSCSLVIPRYNAKIIAVSREQSFRGAKHGRHRPDLIIADDIEDLASVKSEDSRRNTYNWFNSEVLPLRSENTKTILIGNLLHEDSLIMRLAKQIEAGSRSGIFKHYPLLDENDNIAWPGKYPDMDAIETEKKTIGDPFAWLREYLLIIADDQEPVIEKNWIHRYQELREVLRNESFAYAGGVDLAVSESVKADFTAIVMCKIIGSGDKRKIFILPNPINSRMRFPVTVDNICTIVESFGKTTNHKFYIEEVGTQRGLTQTLQDKRIKAVGMSPGQSDKRTRLSLVSEYIRSGEIVFPENGTDELMKQILNFGLTKHDDLVDAFTTLILGIMKEPPSTCNISFESMQKIRSDMYKAIYHRGNGGSGGMGSGSSHSIEFRDGGIYRRY